MPDEFNRITGLPPSPDPEMTALIAPVSKLAREAGAIIMGYHGKAYDITIKDDESPVTIADQKSNDFLVEALERLTPQIPVVSEENDIDPKDSTYWAIDPLDGTKEFINQTGGFSVKIALIQAAKPVLGVIYCPVQGVLYSGVENGQALKSTGNNAPLVIRTRQFLEKGSLTVLFNRSHADAALYHEHRQALAALGLSLPANPKTRPGLPRSMQVAEGLADIHAGTGLRRGSGYTWDIAADDVILANAGGTMFALQTGKNLTYDQPRALAPAYLALGDPRLRTKLFP